jgi:pilus assembly protein CpaB
MNRRILIVLTCALMISGGASYLVYRLTDGMRNTARLLPAVQVVAATRDLNGGALLSDADLKMVDWAGPLPKGSTIKKSVAVNRGVTSAIYSGEPVTENRLAPAGSGGGLAATIPAGMRACAVKVNEVVGVGGFVTPGMRVDVLITGTPPGETAAAGSAVKTLLQNIEVLSAGENIEKDKEGKPRQVQVVNLLVAPHQAEVLSLASNETRIQLVLRNPMDTGITSPPGAFMTDLFGEPRVRSLVRASSPRSTSPVLILQPPHREDTPEPANFETVEVLNGAAHTVARFPSTGARQ